MVLIRADGLLHKEDALIFIKAERSVANHKSSTRFKQSVNLAMNLAYGRLSRFSYMD